MAESLLAGRPIRPQPGRAPLGRGSWSVPPGRRTAQPIDPLLLPPEPVLVSRLPPVLAIREGLLPWRRMGGATVVLCADPAASTRHLDLLEAALGPVRLALADPQALHRAIARAIGRPLARVAELRAPSAHSCRSLPGSRVAASVGLGAVLCLMLGLLAPLALMGGLAGLATLVLVLSAGLRLAAVAATLRREPALGGARILPVRLPVISVLVPLYRESEVAATLLPRIAAIDYPRELLDLCLVVEDDDDQTRKALAAAVLPPWAQIVEVPEGTLRTKPRALNYAMNFARGSIIGIYDAEDIPAPDHLRHVATTFVARDGRTACLQGALDYFNHDRNWIARCFTLEYASWFQVLLPGIERLGLAIPLGGTTLFLRREALDKVGGWDAHNVTEDADLGLRLARHGYRTEMIPIATLEEANARPWPWIRQRSRWLKGYAITWAVHMRDPRALWRDLGPRRFWGVQVMFLGTLLQFALAPVLWSFWAIPLGLPHPLGGVAPAGLLVGLSILFLATQVLDIAFAWIGARRAGKGHLGWWAPSLMLYFPLATLAVYRALWELARCPFHWDKTAHGIDLPMAPHTADPASAAAVIPPPGPWPNRAAGGS